ncbi:MAG: alpha/beta hydrolase [Sneathiella sp.]
MVTTCTSDTDLGLLLLHALPFDGSMWGGFADLLPGATYTPTLYDYGSSIEDWAVASLSQVRQKNLIVVGCSAGASCALEIAALSPDRVVTLILIGCKANHNPDPELHAEAVNLLKEGGVAPAWHKYWASLFSKSTDRAVVDNAFHYACQLDPQEISKGVTAFHTRPSRGELLENYENTALVVTGKDDVAPGPKASAALSLTAPNGRLHVIPKCGHYVPLEQPKALRHIIQVEILKHLK